MKNKLLLVVLILSGRVGELPGQDIVEKAFRNGFEQVVHLEGVDSVWLGYEHRNFRNPAHSMLFLLRSISPLPSKRIILVPRYHNVPLGSFDLRNESVYSSSGFDRFTGESDPGNVSSYRFHIRLTPDIQARFGNFDNPVQTKINLLVDTKIFLGHGFALYSGVLFPLTNNLDTQVTNIRPGPTQLQYFGRIASGHFVFISAGSFFYDRYGLDLQYRKYDFTGRLSYGLEAGLTGFYFFPPEGLYTRSINDFYALLDLEYFIPALSSSVGLSMGQFLFKDRGVRFDLVRQYGNLDIGLFAVRSENGMNAGFNLAFSLFPGKIVRTRRFELRTNEDFRWEYGFNNEDLVGRRYRTGTTRLKDRLRAYHTKFITSQIRPRF